MLGSQKVNIHYSEMSVISSKQGENHQNIFFNEKNKDCCCLQIEKRALKNLEKHQNSFKTTRICIKIKFKKIFYET